MFHRKVCFNELIDFYHVGMGDLNPCVMGLMAAF